MKISLIMCILKILTDLCTIKQKIKIKHIFANAVYSVLVVKKVLIEYGEICLIKNDKQSVKLKSDPISEWHSNHVHIHLKKN